MESLLIIFFIYFLILLIAFFAARAADCNHAAFKAAIRDAILALGIFCGPCIIIGTRTPGSDFYIISDCKVCGAKMEGVYTEYDTYYVCENRHGFSPDYYNNYNFYAPEDPADFPFWPNRWDPNQAYLFRNTYIDPPK